MLSRIERCSSDVSCVTTEICARRLSCVTAEMSWPSMQDAPAFQVEEAQQQIDQRRLAGAGAADQADFLARAHIDREAVDQPAFAAVAETNVLEPKRAARDIERAGVGAVGERVRSRDRHHAFLHDTDIFENAGHLPGHPAATR